MAHAYLPALDEFGDTALPLEKLTHKNRHTLVRPVETGRGSWAPFHGPKTCVDRTGRIREKHSFSVERRRGVECLWCGKKWGYSPDKERERD